MWETVTQDYNGCCGRCQAPPSRRGPCCILQWKASHPTSHPPKIMLPPWRSWQLWPIYNEWYRRNYKSLMLLPQPGAILKALASSSCLWDLPMALLQFNFPLLPSPSFHPPHRCCPRHLWHTNLSFRVDFLSYNEYVCKVPLKARHLKAWPREHGIWAEALQDYTKSPWAKEFSRA